MGSTVSSESIQIDALFLSIIDDLSSVNSNYGFYRNNTLSNTIEALKLLKIEYRCGKYNLIVNSIPDIVQNINYVISSTPSNYQILKGCVRNLNILSQKMNIKLNCERKNEFEKFKTENKMLKKQLSEMRSNNIYYNQPPSAPPLHDCKQK